MKRSKSSGLLLAVLLAAVFPTRLAGQQAQRFPYRLAESHRQAELPGPKDAWFRYWDKNRFITYDASPDLTPDKPAVVLYDRNGHVAQEGIIWFEDARSVSISDAAVSKAGELVVSGGTENETGAIANFIASFGPDGHVSHVIRTTPFLPFHVCDPGDGTVWSYGIDQDSEGRGVKESLRLRHYSFIKGQLAAMMDSTILDSPSWSLAHGGHPGALSFRCTSAKVALLNVVSSEYVEVDIPTNTLRVRKLNPLPSAQEVRVTGLALTESGEVFVSLHDRTSQPPRSGVFKLTFNAADIGSWSPIENTVGPYLQGGPIERLLGADDNDLVYTRDLGGRAFWSKYDVDPGKSAP